METVGVEVQVLRDNGFKRRARTQVWTRDNLIQSGLATMDVEQVETGWRVYLKTANGDGERTVDWDTVLATLALFLKS